MGLPCNSPVSSRRRGWVYVLTNRAMPGLVKIGCTKRTPEERARELSDKTGVPAPFVVAWSWPVSDWEAVERLTHNRLDACRPNHNREFFSCSVSKAARAIKHAARAYLRPAWLRLLIGPHRGRVGPRRFGKWCKPGGLEGLAAVSILAALFVVIVEWKPTPALWLPASVRATVYLIEANIN
jgi:hypothetical protein